MTNSIIVFGGSGFIGGHLLERLAARGTHELVSVDVREPKKRIANVDYRHGDVRDLSQLTLSNPVECIYNFAAVHTTPGHPTHEYYETNIAGATQVTAFARRAGVQKIVFTSSISVYGPDEERKTEGTTPHPESAYGWSKWLAEGVHRAWREEDPERRLVIARPAVIFGPGEGGNFARMARLLAKGYFVFPGRRDTIKACFNVDDLIDAIFFAQSHPSQYVLFNAAYPDRYTIEQIVDTMRAVHFQGARTYMIPRALVMSIARLLRPFSASLGIHPDRVLKLIRSTDVYPGWLDSMGHAPAGRLTAAVERWRDATEGRFD